ncbi:hypothetical protein EYF80_000470 [Liparis tanakae]|uniref:Uncharacterized protein n=1 Tax=Liparis tanakae TaxID=230148 RepID=A0A4Z2JIW2_9TELE|nr:hypothetical protein EYF80_000470 [Liparis tanakae]
MCLCPENSGVIVCSLGKRQEKERQTCTFLSRGAARGPLPTGTTCPERYAPQSAAAPLPHGVVY